jgi:hypothetical protein
VQTAMTDISKGLVPETWNGAAWSAEDFRAVLRSIVSSPHADVPVVELQVALTSKFPFFGMRSWGRRGGAAKLESMNKFNLLVRRSFDPLARDIDAAAFRRKKKEVYTLPSAAHVLAARRKLKLLRRTCRFLCWGGIPRYVLERVDDAAAQLLLEQAFAVMNLDVFMKAVGELDSWILRLKPATASCTLSLLHHTSRLPSSSAPITSEPA